MAKDRRKTFSENIKKIIPITESTYQPKREEQKVIKNFINLQPKKKKYKKGITQPKKYSPTKKHFRYNDDD